MKTGAFKHLLGWCCLFSWIVSCGANGLMMATGGEPGRGEGETRRRGDAASGAAGQLEVDTARLYEIVRTLTGIRPFRNYRNLGSLNAIADFIREEFEKDGLLVREQVYEVNGHPYRNIIAETGPEGAPLLITGAHYDVHGDQPGADDNASAVAGLIEAARLVHERREGLKHRHQFIAYTLEEQPFFSSHLMGSHVHAASLSESDATVVGMIGLEMIGYFSDEPGSQKLPFGFMKLLYPTAGNFIAVVGNVKSAGLVHRVSRWMKKADIGVERLAAPEGWVPGIDMSDHRNYWKFGFPAVMVTDTAYLRNPNYHQPTDTIDTLDFERMTEVVRGVVYALANL